MEAAPQLQHMLQLSLPCLNVTGLTDNTALKTPTMRIGIVPDHSSSSSSVRQVKVNVCQER